MVEREHVKNHRHIALSTRFLLEAEAANPSVSREALAEFTMGISSPEDLANTWTGKRVLDSDEQDIGMVDAIWLDPSTLAVEFAGVQTGLVFGKTHLVPAKMVAPFEGDDAIRLVCPGSLVKTAPAFVPGLELAEVDKEQINRHFGVQVPAQRVTDIQEVRPGEGLNPGQAEPPKEPPSLALTAPPLPESEHTAAERAFPTEHPLEHWINEGH
jgi:hypothetical protein